MGIEFGAVPRRFGGEAEKTPHIHMEAKSMRRHNLRDDDEHAFPWGDTPRVEEFRYWSAADMATLVRLAEAQATTRQIALELGRTPLAVRLKASRMGLPLTAHEVRRSAKRHAKRQGKAAAAEVTTLRKRPRLAITVDFDLSTLTRHERRQLAERLREMEREEESVAPGGGAPEEAPPAAARRALRIPAPYDPSAATSARHEAANAERRANRASLGWTRPRATDRPNDDAELWGQVREAMREFRRGARARARAQQVTERVSLDRVEGELARTVDPLERLELESLLQDPAVRARLAALEAEEDARGVPPYERPAEDEYARYRKYLRGR